jgi:hypothetical protein
MARKTKRHAHKCKHGYLKHPRGRKICKKGRRKHKR